MSLPLLYAGGPNGAAVSGDCAPAFRPVFDAFVANFNSRGEIGASIGVTVEGLPVLEAWSGWADTFATRTPYGGAATPSAWRSAAPRVQRRSPPTP